MSLASSPLGRTTSPRSWMTSSTGLRRGQTGPASSPSTGGRGLFGYEPGGCWVARRVDHRRSQPGGFAATSPAGGAPRAGRGRSGIARDGAGAGPGPFSRSSCAPRGCSCAANTVSPSCATSRKRRPGPGRSVPDPARCPHESSNRTLWTIGCARRSTAGRQRRSAAVLIMDVDGFKGVRRPRASRRRSVAAADRVRLEGLLRSSDSGPARRQRVRHPPRSRHGGRGDDRAKVLRVLERPFTIDDRILRISASIASRCIPCREGRVERCGADGRCTWCVRAAAAFVPTRTQVSRIVSRRRAGARHRQRPAGAPLPAHDRSAPRQDDWGGGAGAVAAPGAGSDPSGGVHPRRGGGRPHHAAHPLGAQSRPAAAAGLAGCRYRRRCRGEPLGQVCRMRVLQP